MKLSLSSITTILFIAISVGANAQDKISSTWGDGLKLAAKDSSFALKFGFRFQSLYIGELNSVTNDYSDKMLVRRSRLKFDGWAYNPNIVYKVELAVSNRDHRSGHIAESGNTANIVLDAVIKWKFRPGWQLWVGQTKLPGNRERVISSQKLQFVDRSLVNGRFTLDRDKGVQLRHKSTSGKMVINQALALSMGEGRNIIVDNPKGGHQITGRIELLPFGDFTGKGDYFGSDLKREETPKLSVGITLDRNWNAARQRGNLGSFNTDGAGNYLTNDLTTLHADFMFKHKGWSVSSEYADRATRTVNNGFGTGTGLVAQAGYLFPSNWEAALRFTDINAPRSSSFDDVTEYTVGFSRYVVGHSLKVQGDVSYQNIHTGDNPIIFRLQAEIAL